jgi:acyl transferase domain-containing protein
VDLPTTPFERGRYWLEAPTPVEEAHGRRGLVGTRIESPAFSGVGYSLQLSRATHGYLFDHVVSGQVIAPAATLIELIRANLAVHLAADDITLTDFVLAEPLALDPEGCADVQVLLAPEGDSLGVSVHSRAAAEPRRWVLHATARTSRVHQGDHQAEASLEPARARCSHAVPIDAHYAALTGRAASIWDPPSAA